MSPRFNLSRLICRPAVVAALFLTPLMLGGCSSTSEFLADSLPTWAGGLPPDAPPRPSDPRYPEYERMLREKTAVGAPAKSSESPPKSDVAKPEPVK